MIDLHEIGLILLVIVSVILGASYHKGKVLPDETSYDPVRTGTEGKPQFTKHFN